MEVFGRKKGVHQKRKEPHDRGRTEKERSRKHHIVESLAQKRMTGIFLARRESRIAVGGKKRRLLREGVCQMPLEIRSKDKRNDAIYRGGERQVNPQRGGGVFFLWHADKAFFGSLSKGRELGYGNKKAAQIKNDAAFDEGRGKAKERRHLGGRLRPCRGGLFNCRQPLEEKTPQKFWDKNPEGSHT